MPPPFGLTAGIQCAERLWRIIVCIQGQKKPYPLSGIFRKVKRSA